MDHFKSIEETRQGLMALVREGHEAVINHEQVAEFEQKITDFITSVWESARKVDENTSDGYHTFRELYEFRKLYNAALFNEWAKHDLYDVHKSEKHSDGEFPFDGNWFIVTATLPAGQISNHYKLEDWDLFKCRVADRADEWDGHSPQDVLGRLTALLITSPSNDKV